MVFVLIFIISFIAFSIYNYQKEMKQIDNYMKNNNDAILRNNNRYNNHCWNCGKSIDSFYEKKCSVCGWYICSSCGACKNKPNCNHESWM